MKKSAGVVFLERTINPENGSKEEISKGISETHYTNVNELTSSICRLTIQQNKLEKTYLCLKKRDSTLFNKCLRALKEKNEEKANKCTTKISEIRKNIKFLYNVQIGIERFVLGLVAKLEIGDNDNTRDPKPALLYLRSMFKELSKVRPDISNELENICSGVEDKLGLYKIKNSDSNFKHFREIKNEK
jgi:division protein CdvB (Snf7/Vps24/ESCRT-III family)